VETGVDTLRCVSSSERHPPKGAGKLVGAR
jgi:hypothetical protein